MISLKAHLSRKTCFLEGSTESNCKFRIPGLLCTTSVYTASVNMYTSLDNSIFKMKVNIACYLSCIIVIVHLRYH